MSLPPLRCGCDLQGSSAALPEAGCCAIPDPSVALGVPGEAGGIPQQSSGILHCAEHGERREG